MKKKFLAILFIITCLPFIVFAKDKPFYKKFQTADIEAYYEAKYFNRTIELKNNYYTFSELKKINGSSNIYLSIKKYDVQGNLIKEKTYDDAIIAEVTNDDEYLYFLLTSYKDNKNQIVKIDTDLNVVNTYTLTEDDIYFISSSNINEYMFSYIKFMTVKNNYVNILLGDYILQYDLDLENMNILESDDSKIEEYFPKIYKLGYFSAELYDSNNNYQVYFTDQPCPKALFSNCSPKLVFLNNNDSILWSKDILNYDEEGNSIDVNDVKIVDEYVVVLESTRNNENHFSKIVIYNFNGEIIQEINNKNDILYEDILPTSLGFKVLKINNASNHCDFNFNIQEPYSINAVHVQAGPCQIIQSEEFYYLYYLVDSKVTGNGKIEVSNKAKAGEQVSFKTQADPNYTVKNVTVKDINGNIVNVNNGSFTMPEEDVIIEAEFVILNNPYTKGGLIALIGIILISIGSYLLIRRQKLNN